MVEAELARLWPDGGAARGGFCRESRRHLRRGRAAAHQRAQRRTNVLRIGVLQREGVQPDLARVQFGQQALVVRPFLVVADDDQRAANRAELAEQLQPRLGTRRHAIHERAGRDLQTDVKAVRGSKRGLFA